MPKRIICPFWKWCDTPRLTLHCEGGLITFPDGDAKEFLECQYCASDQGWRRCSIARTLDDYYERTIHHGN